MKPQRMVYIKEGGDVQTDFSPVKEAGQSRFWSH